MKIFIIKYIKEENAVRDSAFSFDLNEIGVGQSQLYYN